ncbi:MAG TPA: response regulator [Nitrospiraceae bacterium]|nr:response regulator [Nitrospiraceae bacterium]
MNSIDILVVEDNDDDIVLIQEAFAEGKLINRISCVRDGEEAMAFLRKEGAYAGAPSPGMVLLDINMPKKNGFEVLADIKADSRLRALPVIMLTVSDREEDIVRSFEQGACSYIRKPVTLTRFIAVVKEFQLYWSLVSRVPTVHG